MSLWLTVLLASGAAVAVLPTVSALATEDAAIKAAETLLVDNGEGELMASDCRVPKL